MSIYDGKDTSELGSSAIYWGKSTSAVSSIYWGKGTSAVWPPAAATYSLTLTISGNTTNATKSATSLTITSGGSATFTVAANTDYDLTAAAVSLTETSGGSYYSTSKSYDSATDTVTVTVTAATLTANRTGTLTVGGSATATSYTFTISFVDSTGNNMSFSTTNFVVTGAVGTSLNGSRDATYSSGYEAGTIGASDNSSTISTSASDSTVSWTGTMPSGGGTATITVTGSADSQTNSGSISYTGTLANATITTAFSPTTFSGTEGTNVAYSGTWTANTGYRFGPANNKTTTATETGNATIPDVGNISVTVGTITAPTQVFSGNITYTTASNVTASGGVSTYSNLYGTETVSYSVTLTPATGYVFSDGTTSKTATGNVSIGSGGDKTVNLSSNTVTRHNITVVHTTAPTNVAVSGINSSNTWASASTHEVTVAANTGYSYSNASQLTVSITGTDAGSLSVSDKTYNSSTDTHTFTITVATLTKASNNAVVSITGNPAQDAVNATAGSLPTGTLNFPALSSSATRTTSVSGVTPSNGRWNLNITGISGITISGASNSGNDSNITLSQASFLSADTGTLNLRPGTSGSGTTLDTQNIVRS